MTTEGQKDVKLMALDDVIKANKKDGKGGRLKNITNRRRRRSYLNRLYKSENPKKDNRRRIQIENLHREMTHEECEKAINRLDNAEINGVRIRVKYAPSQTNRYGRRNRSAGVQRRNLRRMNRTNRRGLRNRRMGRRGNRDRTSFGRKGLRPKRRNFRRTLGRRGQEKKQN